MKRAMKVFIFVLAFLLVVPFAVFQTGSKQTSAATVENDARYEAFSTEIGSIIMEYSWFNQRVAGSSDATNTRDEESAASYIYTQMLATSCTPKNTTKVTNGVQTFQFLSNFSGLYQTSQNIVFEHKANNSSRKIIIGTNYDSFAIKSNEETAEIVGVEGINESAGSVAMMLYLARHIDELALDINVEFIFFGAGGCNNAGSKYYVQGIEKTEQDNILCMINFDNITIGKQLYFYVDEFENDLSKLLVNLNQSKTTEIKQVDTLHLNKTEAAYEDSLGLGYTHVGLSSNNINFMKLGITSLNIFAGDYESGIVLGKSEYSYFQSITHTEHDTLAYILEQYDEGTINKNLFNVYDGVVKTITDKNFVNALITSQGQTRVDYNIFANQKLAVFMTVLAFGVMICVAIVIHYFLTKRSYYANVEMEFLSTVVKISEQLDDKDTDLEVTKIVSQTIANDIRKDKTIKVKKKEK